MPTCLSRRNKNYVRSIFYRFISEVNWMKVKKKITLMIKRKERKNFEEEEDRKRVEKRLLGLSGGFFPGLAGDFLDYLRHFLEKS